MFRHSSPNENRLRWNVDVIDDDTKKLIAIAKPYGGWVSDNQQIALVLPYWVSIAVSGVLAVIPLIRYSSRFSLRTLLLATTLLALVLGFAAWLLR